MTSSTADADRALVADALRQAEGERTLGGEFRRAALRRLPVETAARLLRQEIAEALERPTWPLRDRLVEHLFVTEGQECIPGDVVVVGGTILMRSDGARLVMLPSDMSKILEP